MSTVTMLSQRDVQTDADDRGWLATYQHVNSVDNHLRWRSHFGIVVTNLSPGCAGGGGVYSVQYPGITREQQ